MLTFCIGYVLGLATIPAIIFAAAWLAEGFAGCGDAPGD